MKKYFLAMFAIACVLGLRAQYTLTASSNPVVGDVYQYYLMDTTGVTFGSTGTAQVWNYTGLASYPTLVTETYTTVASTPSASLFPAASIASETNWGFNYYHMSATERSLAGTVSKSSNGVQSVNTNPVVFCVLPFSYGSSAVSNNFTTTVTSSFGPGSNHYGVMTITAEGTGTLILPDGTPYANVLKIKTVKTDTAVVDRAFSTEVSCKWYSAASKFPLLEVAVAVFGDDSGIHFVNKTIRMINIQDVGLHDPIEATAAFSIYPNPSQTHLFVDVEAGPENPCSIDIVDLWGRIVKQETFRPVNSGMQHNCIDLSMLSAGTYFVKLRSAGREGVRRLVID